MSSPHRHPFRESYRPAATGRAEYDKACQAAWDAHWDRMDAARAKSWEQYGVDIDAAWMTFMGPDPRDATKRHPAPRSGGSDAEV